MKKTLLFVIIFAAFISVTNAQNASEYFPTNDLGHVWNYKITTLDTLGEPIESSAYYEIDSLVSQDFFHEKNSYLLLSKSGTANSIQMLPYIDSSFVNFDGNVANVYMQSLLAQYMAGFLDEGGSPYSGWYPVFDVTATLNRSVELFRVDTTITIDSISVPSRLTVERKRLSDELIQTEIGLFTTKKFEISFNVYYMVGIIPLKILSIPTNIWLAENNWIVKEKRESLWFSYSDLGIPPIFIPGSDKIVVSEITGVSEESNYPNQFSLEQNYPNPFNPTTTINYTVASGNLTSIVNLSVFDVLGRKVATIVNKEQTPGNYSVRFDASRFSSGIYFYKLSSGNIVKIRKMLLVK